MTRNTISTIFLYLSVSFLVAILAETLFRYSVRSFIDIKLFFIITLAFGIFSLFEKEEHRSRKEEKNFYIPLLIIITIAGFILRIYDLGVQSYWIDEGYSVLASMKILENGIPLMDSGIIYSRAFIHNYINSFFMLILGQSEFSTRIFSVIIGTAIIPLSYLIVKRFFSDKTAILTSIFVAFSYSQILWSRQARMYIFLEMLTIIAIYFYLRYDEGKEIKHLILALITLVIAADTHLYALVLVPAMGLHFLITNNRGIKKISREILAWIRDFKEHDAKRKAIYLSIIAVCIFLTYRVIKVITGLKSVVSYYNVYQRFLIWEYFAFLFLGVIGFVISRKRKESMFFAIYFLATFIVLAFFTRLLAFRYLFALSIVLYIFTSEYIVGVTEGIKNKIINHIVILFIISIIMTSGFVFIPRTYYELEAATPQPDFKAAYSYVKDLESSKPLIVSFPQMAEIYHEKGDYWVSFSLSERGDYPTEDKYGGLPLTNLSHMQELDSFILVADDMALTRIRPTEKDYILNNTVQKQFGDEFYKRIFVFEK